MVVLKKRVRNFLFLLPFLCYSDFFDDYEIFAILLSQLLVIHEISKNRTKPNTFLKQKSSATQPETRKLHQVCCRLVTLLSSSRYQDAFALLAPA